MWITESVWATLDFSAFWLCHIKPAWPNLPSWIVPAFLSGCITFLQHQKYPKWSYGTITVFLYFSNNDLDPSNLKSNPILVSNNFTKFQQNTSIIDKVIELSTLDGCKSCHFFMLYCPIPVVDIISSTVWFFYS